MNTTMLKDALGHAAPEEAGRKVGINTRAQNVAYGRGVLVGLVSCLMATGMDFDDAWRLLLEQGSPLLPDCIPPSWPSAADYQAANRNQWTAEDILRNEG